MAFRVPEDELELRATRSRGPGGQHVNRAATRVEVRWNVARSPTLDEGQRARLLDKLGNRLDTRGTLRVVSDRHRSQYRNRLEAVRRLNELVAAALRRSPPRRKTAPPAAATERRLEEKRRRGEAKRQRRPVEPDE